MKPIVLDDIEPIPDFVAQRENRLGKIIALKKPRRLSVGPNLTFVFENRETIRFQIQEMVRVERLEDPAKVKEEVDVYNSLLPGPGELSATLFIEVTSQNRSSRSSFPDRPGRRASCRSRSRALAPGRFEGGRRQDRRRPREFPFSPRLSRLRVAQEIPGGPSSQLHTASGSRTRRRNSSGTSTSHNHPAGKARSGDR
jgi:hypothetical protein